MHKIFIALRRILASLASTPPDDPIARMCPRELADLPVHHPRC